MCGPTDLEKGLQKQEQSFAQELQSDYAQKYASQMGDLTNLTNTLTPTLEAGPNQQGESAPELAAQNTTAINSTGANYANAARALAGQEAGRASSSGLDSGPAQQLKAKLASDAAGSLSNEQLGIVQNNYATGRQNYNNAVSGVNALAGLNNPSPYASEGSAANQSAFGQADTIQQQQAQEFGDIAGAITGAAKTFATGGISNLASGNSFGDNAGSFFSGGLGALAGS